MTLRNPRIVIAALALCCAFLTLPAASVAIAPSVTTQLVTVQPLASQELLDQIAIWQYWAQWCAAGCTDPVDIAYFNGSADGFGGAYGMVDGGASSGDLEQASWLAYLQAGLSYGFPEAVAYYTGQGDAYSEVAGWL